MKSTFDANQETPHPSLTEPQRRSLEVTLCEMERLVLHSRHLREHVINGDEQGVLLQWHAALDDSQLVQLKALEDSTMKQLMALRVAFGLWPQMEDLQHQLRSAFTILWADLEDSRPARMVGYGEIKPEAIDVLDPAIDRLVELTRDFVAVLGDENHDSTRTKKS
jgi:hypothetical protein